MLGVLGARTPILDCGHKVKIVGICHVREALGTRWEKLVGEQVLWSMGAGGGGLGYCGYWANVGTGLTEGNGPVG